MKLKDKLIMCFSNLFKRKVRTILTTMGVVVGTCAIVITVSLGIGMQEAQVAALSQMGDLSIIKINGYGIPPDADQLDDKMLEKLREIEHVTSLTPAYTLKEWGSIGLVSGKYKYDGMIYGVSLKDLNDLGYKMADGSEFPTEFPENTILFSQSAPYDFFNTKKKSNNRVFQQSGKPPLVDLTKDNVYFDIRLPENSTKKVKPIKINYGGIMSEDWSKQPPSGYGIFVDIKDLKKLEDEYNKLNNVKINKNVTKGYDNVTLKVDDMNYVAEVEAQIQALGFTTSSMESVRKPMQEKARKDQLMLGSLGAISLLVAAIGIMNTMIMSIYERTREIGVMKVLGCIINDIRTVFLMEAATIGFLGGIVGVGVSYGLSFLMNTFGSAVPPIDGGGIDGGGMGMGMSMSIGGGSASTPEVLATATSIIPWWLALGAILFATCIGLISGIYPSNRAVGISALAAIKQD